MSASSGSADKTSLKRSMSLATSTSLHRNSFPWGSVAIVSVAGFQAVVHDSPWNVGFPFDAEHNHPNF
jgi:hypothetical protein